MTNILSTKTLSVEHKKKFKNFNIQILEYDFITTLPLSINIETIENQCVVFTSKNSVYPILNQKQKWQNNEMFCVGENTNLLLKKHNIKVAHFEHNATDLANYISTSTHFKKVYFFCGNQRQNDLPNILKKNNIEMIETIVYKTLFSHKKIDTKNINQILFFSPSGVKSFFANNQIDTTINCICIGSTTKKELQKYGVFDIEIPKTPTIENVLKLSISKINS